MTLNEIKTRKAEIRKEVEERGLELSPDRLTELEAEAEKLNDEERALLVEAEKREALIKATLAGQGEIVAQPKEERKMDFNKDELISTVEYRDAWAKKLLGKPLTEVEERAYASGDTHTAIPTLVADKFFEKMKKLAPMLSEITLLRVAGNIKFMVEGTRNAAAAHTENTAVSPAADTVVSVSLGAVEFIKVIRISKAAESMSVPAFIDWLVELLAGDIARAIDNYIINDSANGIAAITYTTSTNQILQTATTGYGYADLLALTALLPAAYDAEAKFLVNKKTLQNKIRGILDSSSRPIFDPTSNMLLGYPVVVDDYVTTANNAVYLGKWSDVVGNLSQEIVVDRSVESGFLNNSVDFRGTAQFDSKPAKIDGIVRLVTTA